MAGPLLVLLQLLALLGGCSGSEREGSRERSLVRLLDELAPADVVAPSSWPGTARGELRFRKDRPGAPAPDGAIEAVALAANEAACVRARVRAQEAQANEARLVVVALAEFDAAAAPADQRRLAAPLDAHVNPRLEARLDRARAGEWQQLEIYVPPRALRAGIALELEAGHGALEVDRVEVELIEPWRRALVAPRAPEDAARTPWRRIVRRLEERVDCLVLAAGGRTRWTLHVPAVDPRWTGLLAPCAPPGSAPSRLRVEIDGQLLAGVELPTPAGIDEVPFAPRAIELDAFAGRDVVLELVAEGPAGAALLIGKPMLLGRPSEPPPPNLVLISIDTLRADQVGCYGAARSVTPRLDRLASEGTRFARVVASSSWTLPSHASMFTGAAPPRHGAVTPSQRVDGARTPLLAALLAQRGYATAAFTGGGFLDPAFGFGVGFGRYSTRDPCRVPLAEQSAPDVADPFAPVSSWLDRNQDQAFFLFLHTYVVHDYMPLPEFVARVCAPAAPAPAPRVAAKVTPRDSARLRVLFGAGFESARADLVTLYAAALAQADERLVGRLLDELHRRGLADRTVVSVVADHGDQWLEHGSAFHNCNLWNELLDVPWIVRGPGVLRGEVVTHPVGHPDVAPTLLARLGIAFEQEVSGVDVLAAGEPSERPLLAHVISPQDGAVDALEVGPWKLLRQRSDAEGRERIQLFRRDRDPGEHDDLALSEPEVARALGRRLDAELERLEAEGGERSSSVSEHAMIDAELEAELRELGYLGGSER